MATGDQADMLARARAVLPAGWFPGTAAPLNTLSFVEYGPSDPIIIGPDSPIIAGGGIISYPSAAPVLDAALAGPAWGWGWLYGLLAYVAAQHRIASATDSNLDLVGADYFGTGLLRRLGEADVAYQQRILANLLAPRGTRSAVIAVLEQLTGKTPIIFEPARAADTGAWGHLGGPTVTGLGYGIAGGWGDLSLPAQFFVTAFRPVGGGIGYAAGWNTGAGGWGIAGGPIEYASMAMIANEVTDADIYAAVNLSRPAGVTAWVAITGTNAPQLGVNFILGYSTLS